MIWNLLSFDNGNVKIDHDFTLRRLESYGLKVLQKGPP